MVIPTEVFIRKGFLGARVVALGERGSRRRKKGWKDCCVIPALGASWCILLGQWKDGSA